MSIRTLLIVIFTLLVSFYLITNKVRSPDQWIIFVSILVMIFTLIKPSKNTLEGFSNDGLVLKSEAVTLADILNNNKKIDLEETISDISAGLVLYTTAFNTTSYPKYGKSWINIAPAPKNSTKECASSDTSLVFELNPIYSRKTGFYLGNNRLVGPLSSALNIQFHNTFTIVMVVKHSNLMVSQGNQEIEFLKLYANSPNNNALSMYLKRDSLSITNNVQMGNLMFQYADQAPKQCLMNKEDDLMHLDKDLLVFYYIVKDIDNIRILYMTEKSNIINQILKFNVANEDITFSNKELIINRLLSWNANLYNFALYNMALTDDDITSFYNHIMGEYIKNVDQGFTKVVNKYNDTIDFLTNFASCPYDKTTCDACTSVTSWCDSTQMMAAGASCKKSIDTFCTINPKNQACKCWDTTSSLYNSESCKLYRSIFGTRDNFLNFLSVEDLEYIKKKYNLLTLDECPKVIDQKPGFAKTSYPDYDYDKLKVTMEEDAYKRLYPAEKCDKKPMGPAPAPASLVRTKVLDKAKDNVDENDVEDKAELEKILLKFPSPASSPAKDISDLFTKDPNLNLDPEKTIAGKQYKEIEELARRQQNSNLRIGQVERPETSKQSQELPALQDKKAFAVGGDRPDSFFNKFIKIMVPSKEEA